MKDKAFLLISVLALASYTSFGSTLRVPQDFPTIQGAVAASVSGDTIVVSPGLYAIPASPCTLANGSQSTCGLVLHDGTALVGSGPAQTVLDFSGAAIGVLLQRGTGTVKLLHLRNASTDIFAYVGSNITVNNVILTDPVGPSVVGMELNQGNSYTIHNNTIDNIHQTGDPSAVAIDIPFFGLADIQNNLLTNNNRGVDAGSFSFGTYAYNNVFGSLDFNWGQCSSAGCTAVSAPASNISADPLYCPDFTLRPGSPARNAGNPAILNSDGTRSDMGAYGGPEAILPPTTCGGPIPIPGPPPPPLGTGPGDSSVSPQAVASEPISTGNGNYYYQHTDLVIPGRGIPLIFQRSYNTLDNYVGPLGVNWTHSYNIILTGTSDGTINIRWGDGHGETFTPSGSGYITQPGVFSTLVRNSDSTFILTQKNQSQYSFSSAGKLTSIKDRNGNAILLTYNDGGNLVQITDTVSRALTLSYDANNHITQVTDPASRTFSFQYSASNDLISATNTAGGVTQFGYDANHHVTSIVQPTGQTLLQNTYDLAGRVVSQTNGRGATTTIAFDVPTVGDRIISDARGQNTIHTYDASLRIVKVKDALLGATAFAYDANNDRTSITNQNGDTTAFTYDTQGNITGITDPLTNTISFTYDSRNSLLSATNARGNTTNFSYDGNGNLAQIHDALGDLTTFTYDGAGELTSKADARGNSSTFSYNSFGNLSRITDPLGNVTTLSYDSIGRLTSLTDPNSHTASAAYDALSRLTTITDPLGNVTKFSYDAVGNLLKITDANGNATSYAYDASNNLTKVTDALAHLTQYAYDGDNNRVSFTNAKGKITAYAYDSLNRLAAVTDPLGFTPSHTYDSVGNVTAITDANGRTNQFAYDALNRLIGISYADGKTVSYAYDANGNRTSMTDSHGATTYNYDSLDRLTSATHPGGKIVAYGYDAVGNRTSLTYPDSKLLTYTFDQANHVSRATDWLSRATNYTYDRASNLTQVLYPTGARLNFNYDAANRLQQLVNTYQGSIGNPISSFTYLLDRVGNRLRVTDGSGKATAYGYDPLYELRSVTVGTGGTNFTYDGVGNRLTLTAPGGTSNAYSYDAADRMLAAGNTTFAYDRNGNQITKTPPNSKPLTYAYDAANRLISVIGSKGNSAFAYDGDGNRISQTVGSGTYNYINDVATALPVALQESGPDGNISYAYGLGLISESGPGFDFFYQYDGLGSVVGLTDPGTKLAGRYSYDAWGQTDASIPDPQLGTRNKLRFTGEALDPGTQLYYLRARYYDPSVGRFISQDPVGHLLSFPAGTTIYAYALANPTRYSDPSGLTANDQSGPLTSQPLLSDTGAIFRYVTSLVNQAGKLVPDYTITPEGGWWRITSNTSAKGALDVVGKATYVFGVALSAWNDIHDPNLSGGLVLGRTSVNIGLGILPGVNLVYGGAKLLAPQQTDAVINKSITSAGGTGADLILGAAKFFGKETEFQNWAAKPSFLDFF